MSTSAFLCILRFSVCLAMTPAAFFLLQIGYSSAELAVEWLMAHPEEPASADAAADENASKAEDEAVKKQLMATLGTDEVPKLEVLLHAWGLSLEPPAKGTPG